MKLESIDLTINEVGKLTLKLERLIRKVMREITEGYRVESIADDIEAKGRPSFEPKQTIVPKQAILKKCVAQSRRSHFSSFIYQIRRS